MYSQRHWASGQPAAHIIRSGAVRPRLPLRRPRPLRQGNRLHHAYNFAGVVEQRVDATEDLPTGDNLILSASFDKDGEDPPGVAAGTLSLYHGDHKVGEGRIRTQPGGFAIAGEGLCVGRDSGAPVTDDYPGAPPWRFTGGAVKRVAVEASGEPYVDLEREAAALIMRE